MTFFVILKATYLLLSSELLESSGGGISIGAIRFVHKRKLLFPADGLHSTGATVTTSSLKYEINQKLTNFKIS